MKKKNQYYSYNAFIYSSYFIKLFLNNFFFFSFSFAVSAFQFLTTPFFFFFDKIFNYTFCYRQASQIIALYFACFP
jgi:hypothetical protein